MLPARHAASMGRRACRARASGEEPDWDAEMQMFRERTMRPNQLETLRKAEEQDIDVGKVRQRRHMI